MGDMPEERITPSAPFDHTGVDFGGPFPMKGHGGSDKGYLCLFVCFATKAVQLQLATSLSGPTCTAALRRFCNAVGGPPKAIYSDNGTNFVGSRNELKDLSEMLSERVDIFNMPALCATMGTRWVHIPPRAPHMGGLWEAAIKSSKHLLKKLIGKTVLTYEELLTVFSLVQEVMNSRPLVELSNDASDLRALTPGMLLNCRLDRHLPLPFPEPEALTRIPPENSKHPMIRWKYINLLAAEFWSRWVKEYLPTLQVRKKWGNEVPNYLPGELCLLAEDGNPCLQWPLARVIKQIKGNDGKCRVVQIQTVNGKFTRPVSKLRRLPYIPRPDVGRSVPIATDDDMSVGQSKSYPPDMAREAVLRVDTAPAKQT